MATKSDVRFCFHRKFYSFDMPSHSKPRSPSVIVTNSLVDKRRRVDSEASGFKSSSMEETNFGNCKRASDSDAVAKFPRIGSACDGKLLPALEALQKEEKRLKIDLCKKRQCLVILMRLKNHWDGSAFRRPFIPKGSGLEVSESSESVHLESIDSKLRKGLYLRTDEFAADIRVMFSNAMLYYSPNNAIHKNAKQLSKFFEMRWASLKERWASEKLKGKGNSGKRISQNLPPSPKPSRKVTKGSVIGTAISSGITESQGRENCVVGIHKKKTEHFLDTLLASKQKLLNFGCRADLQRKKDREAARIALQQMERTVDVDDNLKSFKELQLLCGQSLSNKKDVKPLESFGLFLKHEYIVADWDEEQFLDGDCEEGEIASLRFKGSFFKELK